MASCGRVVCLGWVKGDVPIEARHIVAKEMEILGSRNATDEFADVIALFESRAIDPLRVVTHRVTLDAVPAMLAEWAGDQPAVPFGKVLSDAVTQRELRWQALRPWQWRPLPGEQRLRSLGHGRKLLRSYRLAGARKLLRKVVAC